MAAFETHRPTTGHLTGPLFALVNTLFATVVAWNDKRVTRNALSRLTAHELEDIGLIRGDIDQIIGR